jgi:putative peptidoglycan lipid II flippase
VSKLLRAGTLIALLALLSKGIGFLREAVIFPIFGAGTARDAYAIAYNGLPALALILLGGLNGPFHLATMACVTRLRAAKDDASIPGVLLTLMGLTIVGMGSLALAVGLGAPAVIGAIAPQADPEVARLAVTLLRIMSPLMLIGGLLGVFCGISNVQDRFALPSLSPILSSIAIIAAVLIWRTPEALAWGTLAGGALQLLAQGIPVVLGWKALAGPVERLRPARISHPAVGETIRMLIPAMASSSIGTINVMIATAFASSLAVGVVSRFNAANLLIQLPLGIMLTALLVPMFPVMTKAAAEGDDASLKTWMNKGFQTIVIAAMPMTGLLIVLGEPAIRLAFERGAFTAADTRETALILGILALSIAAYAVRDLLTRVFYARNQSRKPLLVTTVSIGTTFVFCWLLVGRFGAAGLAAATAAVTFANLLMLGGLLKRELGELGLGPSMGTFGKAFLAGLLVSTVCWILRPFIPGEGQVGAFAEILVLGTFGLVAYGGLLSIMRIPLISALLGARRARQTAAEAGASSS